MYPRQVIICWIRNDEPIYATVKSEEEYKELCKRIENNRETIKEFILNCIGE